MGKTINTTTAPKTKAALALIAGALATVPAAAQTVDATEKQILYTIATLRAAQQRCPGFEVDTKVGGGGWALVAGFIRDDQNQDYIKTWTPVAAKVVGVASNFPTFCDDVARRLWPRRRPRAYPTLGDFRLSRDAQSAGYEMRPALAIAAGLVLAGCNTTSSFDALDPLTWAAPPAPSRVMAQPAPAFDPARPGPQAAGATYAPTPAVPVAVPMIFCDTLPPLGEGDPAITDCGP